MKKIFLIALLISSTYSCEDFDGWNVDTKNPSSVPGSYLFTSAQKSLFDQMTSTDVNSNIFKMFAQNWTETQYTDEANYDIRGRDIGGNFSSNIYRNVLNDLQEAKNIISVNEFLDAITDEQIIYDLILKTDNTSDTFRGTVKQLKKLFEN